MTGQLRSTLVAHREQRLALGLTGPECFVFGAANGRPVDRRRVHRIVNEAAQRARLIKRSENLRVHDLRAALLTHAVVDGLDVASVQRLAGHATSRMTLDVYARVQKQKAVAPFGDTEGTVVPLRPAVAS